MDPQLSLDKKPGMDSKPQYHVYKRRWYILLLFSTFSLHQCWVWSTFGPIAFAVQFAYDWSDGTVAMMLNWATILFVVCLIPVSFFLEKYGLRKMLLLVSVTKQS